MLTSHLDFPKEEFLITLRTNLQGSQVFVKHAIKHNTQWIYQSIKHIHNILVQSKQNPITKLNAVKMIQAFLETCEICCLNLIEIYILPIIFSITTYKPQQLGDRRGFRFFIDSGFSPRTPGIQDTGIQFLRLSTEILYVCSIIRTKRTLECEQLNQQSQFVQFYNKFKLAGITEISSPKDLRYFKEDTVQKLHAKYLKKLTEFERVSEGYTEYFVVRMVQSLQIQQNPLFSNAGKTVSSISTDLDFKKILKYGDSFITSPLLQQIVDGLQSTQNFTIKRNYLSLLSDFVKWADIEAFIQINYQQVINDIAMRIAEVSGDAGLDAGELIFPQIKGQRDQKKKFYVQFLKCIEIWAICMKNTMGLEEASIPQEIYTYYKVEKKFKFPQNLLLKKIEEDFKKNEQRNRQKNMKVYERLKLDQTSLVNNKKSITKKSIKQSKQAPQKTITFAGIKNLLEECYDCFDDLFEDQNQIDKKMGKLLKFKNNFENDLENIDTQPTEDEILAVLDDGDALIEHISAIQQFYKEYKKKKITYQEFADQVNVYVDGLDEEEFNNQSESQSKSQSISQSVSANNLSKSSSNSKKLLLKNSISREILNSPQNKNGNILTNSSNVKKRLSIDTPTNNFQVQLGNGQYAKNLPESEGVIKESKGNSKISSKQSLISAKLRSKNSQVSNKHSKASTMKQKSQEVEEGRNFGGNPGFGQMNLQKNIDAMNAIQQSGYTVKSKMQNLISQHRSNRTNQSYQFRNSFQINDFSRDIKNIVYKDIIVNKKLGVKHEGLNAIEKINNLMGDQNPSIITGSKISQKKSMIRASMRKHSQKQNEDFYQDDKKNKVEAQQLNDDYMIAKKNGKKLNNIDQPQSNDQNLKSKASHSSSAGMSSKLKLKREISRLSKRQQNGEISQKSLKRIKFKTNDAEKPTQNFDHYQMLPQVKGEPKKAQNKPEESYYGIQQLESKVKKDKKEFKDCFQVRSSKKNSFFEDMSKTNQYALFRRENKIDGDYLMMKLRKQQAKEKDQDIKGMENRVMKLRNETSRIRRELSARSKGSLSKRSHSNNSSNNSRQFASSQKSHRFSETMKSFSKGKSSHTSKQSIKSIEGRTFKPSLYEQYFDQFASNYVKKTFLKPKTLLHNDENIEIGAICRFEETLKIIIFITPNEQIHEFRYKITEQMALVVKNYPDYYPKIPAKKQVKINLSADLKTMPYTIPEININFIQRGKPKTLSLVLPCPPHRFVQFGNINPGQLAATFEDESSKIIRSDEFRVNKNIFKIQKLTEYFQNLVLIRKENAVSIFGVQGFFKRESFLLKITTKGSSRMVIQGIPKSRPEFLEYMLSSLRYIISQVQ